MKKGMIKVSVMYPSEDRKKFDMEYYTNNHVPLVSKTLGGSLKEASYDKGLDGGEPGSPAIYAAIKYHRVRTRSVASVHVLTTDFNPLT